MKHFITILLCLAAGLCHAQTGATTRGVTLPISPAQITGTAATLNGTEALTNKTINGVKLSGSGSLGLSGSNIVSGGADDDIQLGGADIGSRLYLSNVHDVPYLILRGNVQPGIALSGTAGNDGFQFLVAPGGNLTFYAQSGGGGFGDAFTINYVTGLATFFGGMSGDGSGLDISSNTSYTVENLQGSTLPALNGGALTGLGFSQLGGTPTTLSGYGITDAQAVIVKVSGTLSGGTATISNAAINNKNVWVQDNASSLTNVGALTVTTSSTTATIRSTNVIDVSPFTLFIAP